MKIKVLVTFISLLLIACVQERIEPLSEEMSRQVALLPQDADVLGYVNLERIQNSKISSMVIDSAQFPLYYDKKLDELKSVTGFDFREDARSIYFAAVLHKEEEGMNGLFVVNGDFDVDKIIDFVKFNSKDKKLEEESFHTFKLYLPEKSQYAFCFADGHTLVVGKPAVVKGWLEKSISASEVNISADWLKHIESLKYKNSLWLVMTAEKMVELMNEQSHWPRNFQGIKNIKNGSFSMDFTDQMLFYGRSECTDDEKSTLFADAIKGVLASVKLSVSEERDLVDIINKVKVESKKETVTVQFKMTAEDIEKLIKKKKTYGRSV